MNESFVITSIVALLTVISAIISSRVANNITSNEKEQAWNKHISNVSNVRECDISSNFKMPYEEALNKINTKTHYLSLAIFIGLFIIYGILIFSGCTLINS